MRYVILLGLAAILLFGCTGAPAAPSGPKANGTVPSVPGITDTPAADACTPSYSFSEPAGGTFGKKASVTATATCAAGSKIAVLIDGVEAAGETPSTNDTQPVKLEFVPAKAGTVKLTVESDGQTVFSRNWSVKPLGSEDTSGLEYDSASFKEWRAMAVDVEGPIKPGRVRMFMKRIDFRTQPETEILVELRDDDDGDPGDVLASVKRPINVTTLSDNWISFDFDTKPSLSKGRYWIVLSIEQTESVKLVSDKVNIHYVAVDKQSVGNDYTRQMLLDVDKTTGYASESEWTPLSYDRVYSIVLTSG